MTDAPTSRDVMTYDVLIVGAGPAGLSCAIRIKQYAKEKGQELSVCVIEKGSEVGAHLLSGAVLEPRALNELIPNWREKGAPLDVEATDDNFLFLTKSRAWALPTPPPMENHGNYIISLGYFAQWLAKEAEELGVEIYPGFAAAEVLYNEEGTVVGIATGDVGIDKLGHQGSRFARGVEIRARQTVFAEGCRGSCTKALFEKFDLRRNCDPQTYGLGIKEVWEINPLKHKPGHVQHTIGWPMDFKTYGGSFLYHWADNKVSIGFVVGLDYENPTLSPFEEFQRFKQHPLIRALLEGGKRLSYGARALSEGGLSSLPKLSMPGALIIGDAAGFLNVPKIKGNHTAMKSGMVAAEAIVDHFVNNISFPEIPDYRLRLERTWLWDELYRMRNIRPAFRGGLLLGMIYAALDNLVFRGRAPWTFKNHADNKTLKPLNQVSKIEYPKPDNIFSFDRLSSVFLSNTNHEEDQPAHLRLKDPAVAIETNYLVYGSPEQYYCPAGVYEIVRDAEGNNPQLRINAQNCVHCKTCDIKDPTQNINWCTPEGGGGPNYQGM